MDVARCRMIQLSGAAAQGTDMTSDMNLMQYPCSDKRIHVGYPAQVTRNEI